MANSDPGAQEFLRVLWMLRQSLTYQKARWCGSADNTNTVQLLATAPPLLNWHAWREAAVLATGGSSSSDESNYPLSAVAPLWALPELDVFGQRGVSGQSALSHRWLAGGDGGQALLETMADGSWTSWSRYSYSRLFLVPLLVLGTVALIVPCALVGVLVYRCMRMSSQRDTWRGNRAVAAADSGSGAAPESLFAKADTSHTHRAGEGCLERRTRGRSSSSQPPDAAKVVPPGAGRAAKSPDGCGNWDASERRPVGVQRPWALFLTLVGIVILATGVGIAYHFVRQAGQVLRHTSSTQCSLLRIVAEVLDSGDAIISSNKELNKETYWPGVEEILWSSQNISIMTDNLEQVINESSFDSLESVARFLANVGGDLVLSNKLTMSLRGLKPEKLNITGCELSDEEMPSIRFAEGVESIVEELFDFLKNATTMLDTKVREMLAVTFSGSESPVNLGLKQLSRALAKFRDISFEYLVAGLPRISNAFDNIKTVATVLDIVTTVFRICWLFASTVAMLSLVVWLFLLLRGAFCGETQPRTHSLEPSVTADPLESNTTHPQPPDSSTTANPLDKSAYLRSPDLRSTGTAIVSIEEPRGPKRRQHFTTTTTSTPQHYTVIVWRVAALVVIFSWGFLCLVSFVGFAAFQAASTGSFDVCEAVGVSLGKDAADNSPLKHAAVGSEGAQALPWMSRCVAPPARGNIFSEVTTRLTMIDSLITTAANTASTRVLELMDVDLIRGEMENLAHILRNVPMLINYPWTKSEDLSVKIKDWKEENEMEYIESSMDSTRMSNLVVHADTRFRVAPAYGNRKSVTVCFQPMVQRLLKKLSADDFFEIRSLCYEVAAIRGRTIDSALRFVNEVVEAWNKTTLAGFCTEALEKRNACPSGKIGNVIMLNHSLRGTSEKFAEPLSHDSVVELLVGLEELRGLWTTGLGPDIMTSFVSILCGIMHAEMLYKKEINLDTIDMLNDDVLSLNTWIKKEYRAPLVHENADFFLLVHGNITPAWTDSWSFLEKLLKVNCSLSDTSSESSGCTYGNLVKKAQHFMDTKADNFQQFADRVVSVSSEVLLKSATVIQEPIRSFRRLLERVDCRSITSALLAFPIHEFCEATAPRIQGLSRLCAVSMLLSFSVTVGFIINNYHTLCPRRSE